MAGTYTKVYNIYSPVPLPMFIKVDFIFDASVVGSVTRLISGYGPSSFSFYSPRGDINVGGMTSKIYFPDGEGWTANIYEKAAPYDFNFPFCFSGLKLGWR